MIDPLERTAAWNLCLDERFVTGIDIVDLQHHHLVDVVNDVGDLLLAAARSRRAE